MSFESSTVTTVNDVGLISFLRTARSRVFFMSPGVSLDVGKAIGEIWASLGLHAVSVVVDADPEVYRLGYGTIEGLEYLQQAAEQSHAVLCHQPGVRIGLVIADEAVLVFAPIPELIEAGTKQEIHPNAIQIGSLPDDMAKSTGLCEHGLAERTVGMDAISPSTVRDLAADLQRNPPVPFDVARKVRVFNSRIEFVEFGLKNCMISRKTVPIPSDLMGLARDQRARDLLRSSFRLIGDSNKELSGERVRKLKDYIASRFLVILPGYGTAILRENKGDFDLAVKTLRRFVVRFRKQVEENLQKEIDTNLSALVRALAPAVATSPPDRWVRYVGKSPDSRAVEQMLRRELADIFNTVRNGLVNHMEVSLVYKGVTYELLNDPEFVRVARKAFRGLPELYEEFDAAKEAEKRQLSLDLGAQGRTHC